LLKAVSSNNPDTLVLYYRLETVDRQNDSIRATVALSIKHLDTKVTKSFGTQVAEIRSKATESGMIIDDMGFVAERAILMLMNSEGAASRLNKLVMEIQNSAKQPAGPIKISINCIVFDAKIRKKVTYQLKKQFVEKNIADASQIKTSNTNMTVIAKPEFKDPEELYMEKISPIFEDLGVELEDDKIFYGKGMITIKP